MRAIYAIRSPLGTGTPDGLGSAGGARTPSVIYLERSPGGTGAPADLGAAESLKPGGGTPAATQVGRRRKHKPAEGIAAPGVAEAGLGVLAVAPSGLGPFAVPLVDMAGRVLVEVANPLLLAALQQVLQDEVFQEWLCARVQSAAAVADDELNSDVPREIACSVRAFVSNTCSVVAVYSAARTTGGRSVQLAFASMQDALSSLMNLLTGLGVPKSGGPVVGPVVCPYDALVGDVRVAAQYESVRAGAVHIRYRYSSAIGNQQGVW